jgi:hypothetical protein
MGSKHKLARMKRTYETRIERATEAARFLEEWDLYSNAENSEQTDLLAQFGRMALKGWRHNYRTIYEVDPDLLEQLLDSDVPEEEIPVDVLRRLPHNCPLFVLPEPLLIEHVEFTCAYEQFLLVPLHLDEMKGWLSRPEGSGELRQLLNQYGAKTLEELPVRELLKQGLYIDGPEYATEMKFLWFGRNVDDETDQMITTQTIFLKDQEKLDLRDQLQFIVGQLEDATGDTTAVKRDENWKEIAAKQFAVAVALTLYVCSDEPDMADIQPPQELVRTKTLPPGLPSVKTLGIRIGSALRSYRQASSSDSGDGITRGVMPHVRKAHWHRFWTGPRNGDRKLVIKWLPPIPVNIDKGEIITTIRPVKSA